MSHHHHSVPGWQIAAAADLARRGAAQDARQQAVDDLYRRAAASERHHRATGEITLFGQQAIIERDDLQARGVLPSWAKPSGGGRIAKWVAFLIPVLFFTLCGGTAGDGVGGLFMGVFIGAIGGVVCVGFVLLVSGG